MDATGLATWDAREEEVNQQQQAKFYPPTGVSARVVVRAYREWQRQQAAAK